MFLTVQSTLSRAMPRNIHEMFSFLNTNWDFIFALPHSRWAQIYLSMKLSLSKFSATKNESDTCLYLKYLSISLPFCPTPQNSN